MDFQEVSVALTSCGRPDLLKRTIDSFVQFNSYPIKKFVITEDSGKQLGIEHHYPWIEWHYNPVQLGMMRNLQHAYSLVDSPLIFSCEDDWEFYRSGFIVNSMAVLESNPKILQVWIRSRTDTNGHPIEKDIQIANDVEFQMVSTGYMDCFHGYSTNPGLRRKSDVADFGKIIEGCTNNGEDKVSQYYYEQGFRSAILMDGYVRHIGYGRTVKNENL